ncbi:MAG: DNA/RNA nuclease SfsA [Clostridiales bacterium]|nr:DNA/RNA nuclease SfsA [Clostridiales bacterium]
MKYNNIHKGFFLSRPNRFIAQVEIDGIEHTVHVKNTGRCRELLTDRAEVFLEKSNNPNRKTQYDLIGVRKGDLLVNMDSQAPNKVVKEFLEAGGVFKDLEFLKPETVFESSRFDFYGIHGGKKFYMEVKGVTLENDGIASFPDAPTERGIKHLNELVKAVSRGYEGYVFFLIQMSGVKYFEPNDITHKAFGDALRNAKKNGVKVLCYDCKVFENRLEIGGKVNIKM